MFIHIDLDCYFVSAHRTLDKSLHNIPVAVGGTNDTTKSLVILFDGEIVKNFSIAVSEGETKGGLLQ